MGYCTRTDIENVIAQSLTSATAPTPDSLTSTSSLLNIGNTFNRNLVTYDVLDSYIRIADSQIDATLSELYRTPFEEKVDVEASLFSPIYDHNQFLILDKVLPITAGDQIIIADGDIQERHTIQEIISEATYSTEDDIQYDFPVDSRVVRITYPPPLRWVSARLSAANIYDKYFSAEVSPNNSSFGNMLRDIAQADLQSILNGITILHGHLRIGRRFWNSNLADQYSLPNGGDLSKGMKQTK